MMILILNGQRTGTHRQRVLFGGTREGHTVYLQSRGQRAEGGVVGAGGWICGSHRIPSRQAIGHGADPIGRPVGEDGVADDVLDRQEAPVVRVLSKARLARVSRRPVWGLLVWGSRPV